MEYFFKKIRICTRIIASGILAMIILTFFCRLYYHVPLDCPSNDGVTDYVWEANEKWIRGTEGLGYGMTNNEGHMNTFDYTEGMPIDVLLMGSSHMEAYQVPMKYSTAVRLKNLLGEGKTVYNIASSGQVFLNCFQCIAAAAKKYRPTYIVMETSTISFQESDLVDALNGNYHRVPSHTGGISDLIQKNDFLHLLCVQLAELLESKMGEEDTETKIEDSTELSNNLLDTVMSRIHNAAADVGAKTIIFYHPLINLDENGNLIFETDLDDLARFREACEKNEIVFVDVSDDFEMLYRTEKRLPYGFSNTSVGKGHLNRYGHQVIAERLNTEILSIEQEVM